LAITSSKRIKRRSRGPSILASTSSDAPHRRVAIDPGPSEHDRVSADHAREQHVHRRQRTNLGGGPRRELGIERDECVGRVAVGVGEEQVETDRGRAARRDLLGEPRHNVARQR
jgi:hypothetical protein